MITIKQINNEIVKSIPKPKLEQKNIRGSCYFPEIYSNIFLLARKKSGKTVLLFNILKKCSGKNTRIIIFSGTAYKDHNMMHIRKYLKKKKIEHKVYQSIMDGKANILQEIINQLQIESELADVSSDEDDTDKEYKCIRIDEEYSEEPKKERKSKKLAPEIIFVFDDLGDQLRNKELTKLITRNRHFKSKVIICSQYVHQLEPQAICNLDYVLLFGQLPIDKVERVHKLLELPVDVEKFKIMYVNATQDKYNFFNVSSDGNYRKNFNKQYKISYEKKRYNKNKK